MEKRSHWCRVIVAVLMQIVIAGAQIVPVCDEPILCESNTKVCVTCSADVPASSKERYRCVLDLGSKVVASGANVTYVLSPDFSCTARMFVNDLVQGTHTFQMFVFHEGFGLTSRAAHQLTPSITLTTVSLSVDTNCQYVADGVTSTNCTCTLDKPGHPPGYVNWFEENGNSSLASPVYTVGQTVSVTMSAGQSYVCHGVSTLMTTESEPVQLLPLYGPSQVSIFVEPVSINLCPGTLQTVTVTCYVNSDNVAPEPVFQLYEWSTLVTEAKESLGVDNKYSFVHTLNVTETGNLPLRCDVHNSKSPSLKASSFTTVVSVIAPPEYPPKLTVQGSPYYGYMSPVVELALDESFSAECEILSGEPIVSSVTLVCTGIRTLSAAGNSVALPTVKVDRTFHRQTCVCAASHVTNCYNWTTVVPIRVRYPPEDISLQRTDKGSNSSVDICSRAQPVARMICLASSYPEPTFTIYVNNDLQIPPTYGQSLGNTPDDFVYPYMFKPESPGTYNITCIAQADGLSSTASAQTTIIVKETRPTEPKINITSIGPSGTFLENPEAITQGEDVDITCFVDANYPPVTSEDFRLTCGSKTGYDKISFTSVIYAEDGISCNCSVSHITGCFGGSVSKNFKITSSTSQQSSTNHSDDDDNVTVIGVGAGVAAAVVVIIIVITVVVVVIRRRRYPSKQNSSTTLRPSTPPEDGLDVSTIDTTYLDVVEGPDHAANQGDHLDVPATDNDYLDVIPGPDYSISQEAGYLDVPVIDDVYLDIVDGPDYSVNHAGDSTDISNTESHSAGNQTAHAADGEEIPQYDVIADPYQGPELPPRNK